MNEVQIEQIVKKLTNSWKEEIEKIDVDGFLIQIESINYFPMSNKAKFNDDIRPCYKVNFNYETRFARFNRFALTFAHLDKPVKYKDMHLKWVEKLNKVFIEKFSEDKWYKDYKYSGGNHGEIGFIDNSKVDYMTEQQSRFIVQFYPLGFMADFRNEKLEELGI